MKRFFSILTAVALILATVFTLGSCTTVKKGFKNVAGLNFKIYDDMRKLMVSWADACYRNDDVTFFINAFTKEELNDPEGIDLREDITVPEYTEAFIVFNEYDTKYNAQYAYDSDLNLATFGIHVDGMYCFFAITRNTNVLYVVGMECTEEKENTYKPVFEEWARIMYIG